MSDRQRFCCGKLINMKRNVDLAIVIVIIAVQPQFEVIGLVSFQSIIEAEIATFIVIVVDKITDIRIVQRGYCVVVACGIERIHSAFGRRNLVEYVIAFSFREHGGRCSRYFKYGILIVLTDRIRVCFCRERLSNAQRNHSADHYDRQQNSQCLF